jgi:uncharacterized protein (TIGR02594 family)
MHEIIDVPENVADHAHRLAEAGVKAVIRYYNHANSIKLPTKCLTRGELEALFAAGLSVAVVFEQRGGADGNIGDLEAEAGTRDARRALALAEELGQPPGSAIYFAVDADYFRRAELDRIAPYFEKAARALSVNYDAGVYGSGTLGRHLKNLGLVEHVWLSGSLGWSGTRSALAAGEWTIFQQSLAKRSAVGGFLYDGNVVNPSRAGFGQFGAEGARLTARGEGSAALYRVAVRTSLNLRSGPGESFAVLASLPAGTIVVGQTREGAWIKVDLEGDGHADGYMFAEFLEAVSGGLPLPPPAGARDAAIEPIAVARAEMNLGVAEIRGPQNNPRIVMYHQTTEGRPAGDETPWCSSFVNYCVEQAGLRGTNSRWALSWHEQGWGRDVASDPQEGDIAVFRRSGPGGSGGHVGFFVGGDEHRVEVLGGNQENRVCILSYPRDGRVGDTKYQPMSIRRGLARGAVT